MSTQAGSVSTQVLNTPWTPTRTFVQSDVKGALGIVHKERPKVRDGETESLRSYRVSEPTPCPSDGEPRSDALGQFPSREGNWAGQSGVRLLSRGALGAGFFAPLAHESFPTFLNRELRKFCARNQFG